MHARWLRIAVLAQACWWFGLYVPVHQRGAIPIDTGRQSESVQGCCVGHDNQVPDDPAQRPDDPVRRCAVCYLTAKLDVPPTLDLSILPCGLVGLIEARNEA